MDEATRSKKSKAVKTLFKTWLFLGLALQISALVLWIVANSNQNLFYFRLFLSLFFAIGASLIIPIFWLLGNSQSSKLGSLGSNFDRKTCERVSKMNEEAANERAI